MFARRVPQKTLALLARNLGTLLHAGVGLKRAFEVSANKLSHPATKAALRDVIEQINEGSDVTAALRSHGEFFPSLFTDMLSVAEETGMLPEVLLHLAEHYDNNARLKRETIQSLAWPTIQMVLAVLVIALLIFVLGMLPAGEGKFDMRSLTFGLAGPSGALLWLGGCFSFFAGLYVAVLQLQRAMNAKLIVDPILINVPVLGTCLRSFAIARFSWAFFLTQQSGMPVTQSLEASLRATNNGAFLHAVGPMCADVREGCTITEAFSNARLFPEDYIEMVTVAEESGTVPEALHRLSPQFEETARRSLKMLTRALTVLVWLGLASMIVFFVFRFMLLYISIIQDAASGKF